MDLLNNWNNVKMYDLTQKLSNLTSPWTDVYQAMHIQIFQAT